MWQKTGKGGVLRNCGDFLGCMGKPIPVTLPVKLTPRCFIGSCVFLLLTLRAQEAHPAFPTVKVHIALVVFAWGRALLGRRNSGGMAHSLALLLSIKAE